MPVAIGVWRRHDKAVSNDPFRKRDTEYYRNELQTVEQYVMPYSDLLPGVYKLYCRLLQFQNRAVIRWGFTWYTRLIIIIVNRLRPGS
jgi:hypothetical protein